MSEGYFVYALSDAYMNKTLGVSSVGLRDAVLSQKTYLGKDVMLPNGSTADSVVGEHHLFRRSQFTATCDGNEADVTPFGVQFRVVQEGPHFNKEIWVHNYGTAKTDYTLWLLEDGRAVVVHLSRDEFVPLNPMVPCASMRGVPTPQDPEFEQNKKPVCVEVQGVKPFHNHVTQLLAVLESYDHSTGLYSYLWSPELEQRIRDKTLFDKWMPPPRMGKMQAMWYNVKPYKSSVVGWGHVVRLFGNPLGRDEYNGKLATINAVFWRGNKLLCEFVPLGGELSVVTLPAENGADASRVCDLATLQKHITIPLTKISDGVYEPKAFSVIFFALLASVNSNGSGAGKHARTLRFAPQAQPGSDGTPDPDNVYNVCDSGQLKEEVLLLGQKPSRWWAGVANELVRTLVASKKAGMELPTNANEVLLALRTLRSVAEWEFGKQESDNADWGEAVNASGKKNNNKKNNNKKNRKKKKNKKNKKNKKK